MQELYEQVKGVFLELGVYRYEHIFIDNSSVDKTVEILKDIASKDNNVKIIVNMRNFGQNCSPYHALLQAEGDAVITMAADLQDPPTLIGQFIKRWSKVLKLLWVLRKK